MLGIAVYNRLTHFQTTIPESPVLIGSTGSDPKCVQVRDPLVSSPQIMLQWHDVESNLIQLTNLGPSIVLHSGPRIPRNKTIELELPSFLSVGDSHLHLFDSNATHSLDASLMEMEAVNESYESCDSDSASQPPGVAPSALTLAAWFESLGQLQKSVAGSQQFFVEAARAIFNPGGLDGGIVLQPEKDDWKIAASFIPYPEFGVAYRSDIVERVVATRKSVYHAATLVNQEDPADDVHSCVVVPVLDNENEVSAVIYGFRSQHRTNNRRGVRALEANFVQVVADSVGAAMTRLQSEADAARTRVLLEQAFSPKVARQLETNPNILEGRDREVSVLFADLRGFTPISERVGTRVTYELLTAVMDQFCRIIAHHEGVIIDFYGDGVSAFWNAPLDQPNHALLACQAAMDIADCMPEINRLWQTRLGQPIQVGVGINTGIAQVGNSGSTNRLKYGPRGNTINVASRLENATKQIGIPVLISGTTAECLGDCFKTRRICSTYLKGIQSPLDLFQITRLDEETVPANWETYATALSMLENGQISSAIEILMSLQIADGTDSVCEYLLRQALDLNDPLGASNHSLAIKTEVPASINVTKVELDSDL